jgi:DNA polymerase-3 subunit epsilon
MIIAATAASKDEIAIRILLPAARLEHFIVSKQPVEPLLNVAVIDVETTGTDPLVDQVIDLGYVILQVDAEGDIVDILAVRAALADPGTPLPERISRLTGLTDNDLRGKAIDLDLVEDDFAQVDASFIRQLLPSTARAAWACSLNDFDWLMDAGLDGRALGHLLAQAGFYNDGHRALADVISLIHLLAYPLPTGGTVMRALLANASQDTWRVEATRAPYSARAILKARGYRWDIAARVWWTEVKDGAIEAEELWLFRHVLPDGPSPRLVSMTWHQRHR